jgi:hypothetical protein
LIQILVAGGDGLGLPLSGLSRLDHFQLLHVPQGNVIVAAPLELMIADLFLARTRAQTLSISVSVVSVAFLIVRGGAGGHKVIMVVLSFTMGDGRRDGWDGGAVNLIVQGLLSEARSLHARFFV